MFLLNNFELIFEWAPEQIFGPPENIPYYDVIDIEDSNDTDGNNDSNNDIISIVDRNFDQKEFSTFNHNSE